MEFSSSLLFIVIIFLSVGIGFYIKANPNKSSEYFLGNRSLSWFPLMMTFLATQIGGGFIIGTAESAREVGGFGIFYSLGQGLGFLAFGLGFGARLQSLRLSTCSEVFEVYYQSPFLKKMTSLLSILSLCGILIAQASGLHKFMGSMGWTNELIFLSTWALVILYTTKGGFLAVVFTDTLQACFMILLLIIAFFTATVRAPDISTLSFSSNSVSIPWTLLLMPFLYMFIEQDMVQRCFAGRSKGDVTKASLFAFLCLVLLAFIPVYFGVLAKSATPHTGTTSAFMDAVFSYCSPMVYGMCGICVLLAIISTSSSLLLAISSNVALDFSSKTRHYSKAITMSIGGLALLGSYFSSNIFGWMIMSYELSVSCLFVPLFIAVLYQDRCTGFKMSAFYACIFGFIGFIIRQCYSEIDPTGLFSVLLSCLGYGIGMIATRKTAQTTPLNI